MTCVCFPGYEGDASIECAPVKTCPPGRGLVLDAREECVCPPGHAFDEDGNCIPCPREFGFIVDERGVCVCHQPNCNCIQGYTGNPRTGCVPIVTTPPPPTDF